MTDSLGQRAKFGVLAPQAGDRDQHRNVLVCATPVRHQGQDSRLGVAASQPL